MNFFLILLNNYLIVFAIVKMAQVSLSNVSLSFLRNQLNINGPISFSQLYNYTTDIPKIGEFDIVELFGKYRNFIPYDFSNLVNWYDANSINYKDYQNNYQKVFTWNDRSGSNNNAIQSNYLYQPYYLNSGLNGKPSVYFNNYNNFIDIPFHMNFNSINNTNEITIAAVFNSSGFKSNYIFSSQDIIIKHVNKAPVIYVNTFNNNINTASNFTFLDFVPNIYIATVFIDNNGSVKSQIRINGVIGDEYYHDNSLTTLNISNCTMGGNVNTYNTLYGNISELIIYNKKLVNSNLDILEGYLSSKWWGVPSYLNKSLKYYNIPVLEPYKSPILLYNFDEYTSSSNIITLKNYGLSSSSLDGIVNNINYSIQSSYYTGYTNHINDLFIWYKFDSTNNYIYLNNGYSGPVYNLINPNGKTSYTTDYIRGDGSLRLLTTEISTTNTSTNLINFNTLSTEYTLSFWYKVIALIGSTDTLFSLSGSPNIGSRFYIQRDGSTNNIIIGLPYTSSIIRINNAIFDDGLWRHIAICLIKNNTNNLIFSVYLNGVNIINNSLLNGAWFGNYTNYISINQYSTGSGLYSGFGANMLYDDFRLYTKFLSESQVQSIMGFPISKQNGLKNSFGYFWNSYNTNFNINTSFNIDYNSFINNVFITDKILTISYDLLINPDVSYNSDYEINILHCNNFNTDKLKIVHRFFISSTNYIKIIINDPSTTNATTVYFQNNITDNLSHNYIFIIPITLSGSNTISLYIDGIITNTVFISYSEPVINQQFVKIGSYYNSLSILNTSPFVLEDFRIYNRLIDNSEIQYINSNYNISPIHSYYNNKSFPFTSMIFDSCGRTSNAYGPVYSNLINNYSSNGSWVNDNKIINSFNGVQYFQVPESGYYSIITAGASGGFSGTSFTTSGRGIILKNYSYLNRFDILQILIGQRGGNGIKSSRPNEQLLHGQGGGGGCTCVITSNSSKILLISGGGGGNGQFMPNGENEIGTDGTRTTSGNLDSTNSGIASYNGNGGNVGLYGTSKGCGVGGAGFFEDGHNKISIYGGLYAGYSILNTIKGSNIGKPYYQNYGGIGGFPGGSTGGTNYSLDLVWGGGGASGYSGGVGGSASYFEGQTHGGGGGGSYDNSGILNNGTVLKSYGNNGYNVGDGYAIIKFLTPYSFLDYANANKNIIRNGLTFLIEPSNQICYDIHNTPTSIVNLVNGKYAFLNNNYSYNYNNNSIILQNFYHVLSDNNSYLHANTFDEIHTVSIWYMVLSEPNDGACFIDTFNDLGHIYNNIVGADWNDGINDINEGGIMYIDSSNIPSTINWNNLTTPLNTWKNITLISNSNLSNEIAFFNNDTANAGINVEFGPILVYNRIISSQENLINYNAFANLYNTPYKFYYIGINQFYKVPPNINRIFVKTWSSGGGSGSYANQDGYYGANGGSGIFISCYINVNPGDLLTIIVPNGGYFGILNTRSQGGWPNGGEGGFKSGGGGGACIIMRNTEYLLISSGGSGAGSFYGTFDLINTPSYVNNYCRGANAGFLIGETTNGAESGNPGTQSSGGLASSTTFNNFITGQNGQQYIGASGGVNFGGGSGQGYWSGSGGSEKQYFICGGSGSSSYLSQYCSDANYIIGDNNGNAPAQSDIDYPQTGVGFGAAQNSQSNGGNGFCIIRNVL